ncbi:MAG: hypothetical protein JWM80_2799 [Cyanobacteria bacterium RYN_339]|nr:hypothetical protein [Cyanobacteria bacterium RYN_339]
MSEFQYYAFRALDRSLTASEMAALRALSTRAVITPTSFTNDYQWGNFKGDPDRLVEQYFDAYCYITNWGTRQLQWRFPARMVDEQGFTAFLVDERVALRRGPGFVILSLTADDQEGYWELDREPEIWLPATLPLRDDLMNGDLRALYLAWLAAVQDGYVDNDAGEPPVPPGLKKLSPALEALAELLMLDADLINAAACGSEQAPAPAGPTREAVGQWIARLPAAERDALLVRMVADGDASVSPELRRRFRESAGPAAKRMAPAEARTAGALLALAEQLAGERKRQASEQAERARTRYLDELARREPAAWQEIEGVFDAPLKSHAKGAAYEQKAKLLHDLRDLAVREGRVGEFEAKLTALRARYGKRAAFWTRFDGSSRS